MRIEEIAEDFTAVSGCAAVFDLESLAVISNDGKEVRAGAGALTGPEWFEEAGQEGSQAEDFQDEAGRANPTGGGRTVAPDQQSEGEQEGQDSQPEPAGVGKYQGGGQHLRR